MRPTDTQGHQMRWHLCPTWGSHHPDTAQTPVADKKEDTDTYQEEGHPAAGHLAGLSVSHITLFSVYTFPS